MENYNHKNYGSFEAYWNGSHAIVIDRESGDEVKVYSGELAGECANMWAELAHYRTDVYV